MQQLYYRLANFNYKLFKKTQDIRQLENSFFYLKISLRARNNAFTFQKSKILSNVARQIEVQNLESEILNTKKEKEISDLKATKQQLIIYFVIFVLVVVIVFSGLLYKRFKLTSKQKQIIEEKNKEVEEKNTAIMDSIRYAQRIQKSLLPTEKYIQRVLKK